MDPTWFVFGCRSCSRCCCCCCLCGWYFTEPQPRQARPPTGHNILAVGLGSRGGRIPRARERWIRTERKEPIEYPKVDDLVGHRNVPEGMVVGSQKIHFGGGVPLVDICCGAGKDLGLALEGGHAIEGFDGLRIQGFLTEMGIQYHVIVLVVATELFLVPERGRYGSGNGRVPTGLGSGHGPAQRHFGGDRGGKPRGDSRGRVLDELLVLEVVIGSGNVNEFLDGIVGDILANTLFQSQEVVVVGGIAIDNGLLFRSQSSHWHCDGFLPEVDELGGESARFQSTNGVMNSIASSVGGGAGLCEGRDIDILVAVGGRLYLGLVLL